MIDRDGGKLPARLLLNNGYTGASAELLTSNDRALSKLFRPIHIQYNPQGFVYSSIPYVSIFRLHDAIPHEIS